MFGRSYGFGLSWAVLGCVRSFWVVLRSQCSFKLFWVVLRRARASSFIWLFEACNGCFYVLLDRSELLKSFKLFNSVSGCITLCHRCLSSLFWKSLCCFFCISNLLQIGLGSLGC